MSSSDVIELGSSDDEADPVPKKKKTTLNAMVHFPNEVPGLIIKPAKPPLPNLQKVLAGGAITITNLKKVNITQINKGKPNGISVKKITPRAPLKTPMVKNISIKNPMAINNLSVNPLSLIKQQNTRFQVPKLSLPPGITVKRTGISHNTLSNVSSKRKNQNFKRKRSGEIITTVNLDDEEMPLTSAASPQWYLRPEEQTCKSVGKKENETEDNQNNMETTSNMELENNKEPNTRSYIEITIEDSPIKPIQVKKGFEIGSELPITIEDSPIKPKKSAQENPCASDSDTEKTNCTEPQSKKKLDYPHDEEDPSNKGEQNVVEINLDIIPSANKSTEKTAVDIAAVVVNETKEDTKGDVPLKVQTELLTKEVIDEEKPNKTNLGQQNAMGEFHSVYQKFIDLCFELENSDDMTKIVEKKIKTYYRQCPKDYVESEEFIDMVSSKIFAMKAAPDKMYLYIKDIVDELNLQRKSAKAVELTNKENKEAENDKYFIVDNASYDTKRLRQIRKLDKTIKKLHRAIQKLEEQEVEFEDEEDSVYLLTERYKERLLRVHAKFCQLTNTKMPSEPRIQIEARPGFPPGPAKRLEKWVNKKVHIGTPLPFPDFHDVLRCVRDANEEDRLGWNEADIMEEARDLFTRCGKKLQRRRQENEWRIAAARISHDASTLDPAEKSDDLKKKLEENKTVAAKKEIELLNKYADKQNQLKLVGEEIGDKEAEESPVESEDDDGNDDSNSLEDKQKRKERLKRLLQEKTKKTVSKEENIINEVKINKEENDEEEKELECETVTKEAENKNVETQEIMNETEETGNDVITDIMEDGPSKEQLNEKSGLDLYDVDSDVDELHLLQKLYSENEMNSSTQGSDSDSPIAISDTLDSDSDNESVKIRQSDDIISIENSSYSESEETKDACVHVRESENNRIDSLRLQNAEVVLFSSTPGDKLDEDEENILLASSEEENDENANGDSDKAKTTTCNIQLSNDSSTQNDCEVILDNCNKNSLENDVGMHEVHLNEQEVGKLDKNITSNVSKNSMFSNNHKQFEYNEISQQNNKQSQNHVEIDEPMESLASIEKNQENVKHKGNNVIKSKVFQAEAKRISVEVESESDIKSSTDADNHKYDNNSPLKNKIQSDKMELTTVVTSKEITSAHHTDKLEEYKICSESKVVHDKDECASKNIETISAEQDFNESEGMDVNVEIAEQDVSLVNHQTTCAEVEMATSVQ